MKVYSSITEVVGGTPLVRINKLAPEAEIYAKLEFFNPTSSVKDRIAVSMIEAAEASGELKKGGTVIEPTSGNTGLGLAMVTAAKGYRLIITMPETMSVERRALIAQLGAEIVLTEGRLGMQGAIDKANELKDEIDGEIVLQQFNNPANPATHEKHTGVEIWNDTDGEVDVFVAGVGTGGTLTGVGHYLKSRKESVKIVAVEPLTSAVLSGEKPGKHGIQGIGAGFIPNVVDTDLIDDVIKVSDEDAVETARKLAASEGILCGISSGAAVTAAVRISQMPEYSGKKIVVLLPDTGERYLSTALFNLS